MINFIICEDEKDIRNNTKKQVCNFMMKYDMDYKVYEFESYNKRFEELVKSYKGFKIYFLDIKTKNGSGLDAARMIREKYDDWVSAIIIMTSFAEYKYEALSSRLYLLDFITKFDDCNRKIKEDLSIAMKSYDKRYKMLNFEYNHTYYMIEYRQIIYIEKEPDSKRCIIKTKYGNQVIPGTLSEVYKKLDDRFLKVHKSMIINTNEILKYEIRKNKLTFKNGEHTHLVSRSKKKELIESVCSNN